MLTPRIKKVSFIGNSKIAHRFKCELKWLPDMPALWLTRYRSWVDTASRPVSAEIGSLPPQV